MNFCSVFTDSVFVWELLKGGGSECGLRVTEVWLLVWDGMETTLAVSLAL